ncbi:hypothetical protein R1flu_020812 [Riccia fluitans]|uniref:Uncharacterized protein n=1 Tax=Riccia fluitans TaxID=41844 RepID=A0ABD1ZRA3_9MARC
MEGSFSSSSSADRWQQGLKMLEEINNLIDLTNSSTAGQAAENENEEGENSQRSWSPNIVHSLNQLSLEVANE